VFACREIIDHSIVVLHTLRALFVNRQTHPGRHTPSTWKHSFGSGGVSEKAYASRYATPVL